MLTRIALSLVFCCLFACGGNSRAPVEDHSVQPQYSTHVVKRGDTLYSIAFRYGLDYRKVAAANGITAPYTIYPDQKIYLYEVAPPGLPSAARTAPVRPSTPIYTTTPRSDPAIRGAAPSTAAIPSKPVASAPATAPALTVTHSDDSAVTQETNTQSSVDKTTVRDAAENTASNTANNAANKTIDNPSVNTGNTAPGSTSETGGKVENWLWPTQGPVTRGFSESLHKGIDIGGQRGDPVIAVAAGKVVYAGSGIVGFGELLILKHNDVYLSAYGHNDRLLVAEGQSVAAGQTIAEKGSSGTDTVKLHFEIRKEGKPIDPQRLLPRR